MDAFATATEQLALLRSRTVTARELLDFHLARVEALNPRINAVVTLDTDRARAAASDADEAAARGEWLGPLHGLPMTVKDAFETAGLRTTCGDPALASHIPERDATAVARLRSAGAIIFGKTNTPTQTMDGQTDNPVFGRTNNPHDESRIAGGSSGGSAAAVAAGFTPLELGSDIGGSIRTPSHCCGVFGHKPSWGIVPERGHIPGPPGALRWRDLNVNGPIARSAMDLDLALSVLAGPDELEAPGWRLELRPPRHDSLAGFRIAAWLDDPFCPTDRAMLAVFEQAITALESAGAKVDRNARPALTLQEAFSTYLPLLLHEVRGDRPHAEYIANDNARQAHRHAWASFFRDFDILLAPVMFIPAPDHAVPYVPLSERTFTVDGVKRSGRDFLIWAGLVGSAKLPSTVFPVDRVGTVPVGLQAIGPYLEDRTTIAFAHHASAVLGGFTPPPGF